LILVAAGRLRVLARFFTVERAGLAHSARIAQLRSARQEAPGELIVKRRKRWTRG
jgi:hypothetical protein